VALKMSFHYWLNQGHGEKTRFIALTGSYHGETLGALSVSDVALYRKTYAPLLLTPNWHPRPTPTKASPAKPEQIATRRLGEMRALLERHAHETCAVIVEPLVQCAGGMRMYDPPTSPACARCATSSTCTSSPTKSPSASAAPARCSPASRRHLAGFHVPVQGPDRRFMPLSAVVTTQHVYEAFYAEYNAGKAFLHSHSYTGNPLACRAALETMEDLPRRPRAGTQPRACAHIWQTRIAPLRDHPHVADVRQPA
jgi:adenosylmethionine-8-amino-7-oxononanoate aminotransferase